MSPSGGTRALGSSVIDASCLVLEPDWPKAPVARRLLYRRARARQSPAAALFVRRSTLETSRNAASMVYEGLRHRALRNSRPPIGPREVNFFPYLSIQLLALVDYFRGGDHSVSSSSESGGRRCRPGEGCARADSSKTSPPGVIGRGELRFGGTVRRCDATFACLCTGAPDSHKSASIAAPASGRTDAAPTGDDADVAPAGDRTGVAPARHGVERDRVAGRVRAQDRGRRLARSDGGVGHHELPRSRAFRLRARIRQQ